MSQNTMMMTNDDGDDGDTNNSEDTATDIITALVVFIAAIVTLLFRLLSLIAVVISWFFFLLSVAPYLLLGVGVGIILIPYVQYQDTVIEEIDFFLRCRVFPFYNTWPRQLVVFVQFFWNPLICYYDAVMWLPFGIIQNVIFPLLIDCGIFQTALAFLQFLLVFLTDFVINYIASLQFVTADFDFVPSGVAWSAFWAQWQESLFCTCRDLQPFFQASWILTAFPLIIPLPVQIFFGFPTQISAMVPRIATIYTGPMVGLLAGNQMGDPQSWCAVWSAFNGVNNVAQQLFRVIVGILTLQFNSNFPRPDFRQAANNFCQASHCLVRSIENVNQFLFDTFIPIPFLQWNEFLCIYDSFLCLVIRAADNILRILINIDRVVQYPVDPFYEEVVVPDVIYWLNLIAPLRYQTPTTFVSQFPVNYTSWNWPTNSSLIPGTLQPNPIFGEKRFSDCICIYFRRLICDPSDATTPCFDPGAQSILGPFDPCCIFIEALTTVADAVAFPFDITRHLYDFSVTTIFANNQYLTTAIARDLTELVGCILEAFGFIPVVGPCITEFLKSIVEFIFDLVDFLLRVVTGLIFLAYYLVFNIDNFITNRGEAIQFLLNITNKLTNATEAGSSINCACFVLNFGIPIPPIPCTSCVPTGFVTPTLDSARKRFPTTYAMLDKMKRDRVLRSNPADIYDGLRNLTHYSMTGEDYSMLQRQLDRSERSIRDRVHDTMQKLRDPYYCASDDAECAERATANQTFTLSPTNPPVGASCTDPVPPCFDLCCNIRTTADLLYKTIFLLGQTINSLAQDWDIGFPFFVTGDVSICSAQCPTQQTGTTDCSVPCPGINFTFEDALIDMVLAQAQFLSCFCNLFNLVIPITGFPSIYTERPDVCCWVIRLGDLIAASLLVLIRMIKELAQGNVSPPGTPPFPYFTQGQFITDINQIFDIQLLVIECLGFLVRSIFPVQTVADLDVYCPVENVALLVISLTRWLTNIIISLGTIQFAIGQNYLIDPNCNWEATGCVPLVTNLGVYRDGVVVIDALFGTSGGACADNLVSGACTPTHGTDLGVGGITQCVCQLVSTIFPIRPNTALPTGPPNNCPIVDVCCPVRQVSFYMNELNKFMLQGLITFWQRWDGAYPSAFFAFFFCDETADPLPVGCGQLRPAINALTDVISLCICQYFSLLDAFLQNFFSGFNCFCGGGTYPFGIFCTVGDLVFVVITQVVELIRRANDLSYWQPDGYPAPDLTLTWSFRFFEPIQDVLCDFIGANVCFINAIVPFCPNWLSRLFQSMNIWLFIQPAIRIGNFIEGFITTFAGAPCGSAVQVRAYGINLSCLTGSLISLFTFFFDAALADGMITCRQDICSCNNDQFNTGGGFAEYVFSNAISQNVFGIDGRIPQPCTIGSAFVDTPTWFQTCCNGTAATYTLPNGQLKVCPAYNNTGDPVPECRPRCFPTQPNPCQYVIPALPVCNSIVGPLPMDGIFMATLRYVRCLFQLGFGGGALFDGAITLTSVAWQLTKPIINVVAGGIILIFDLFISPGGPFDFLFKIVDFFASFSSIFNAPIIFPSGVDPFAKKNMISSVPWYHETRTMPSGIQTYGGIFQSLHAIFTDYRVNDCDGDLRECVNRNFNIDCPDMQCALDVLHHKFNNTGTYMQETDVSRETPCATVVMRTSVDPSNSSAFIVDGANVLADRMMFLECVDKRIMGERLRDCLFPNFPAALMYTSWRYMPELLRELNDSFGKHGSLPHAQQHDEPFDARYAEVEREVAERRRRLLAMNRFSHGLGPVVARFDEFEYKLRSGYYRHLVNRIARNGMKRDARHSVGNYGLLVMGAAQEMGSVLTRVPEAVRASFGSMAATWDFVTDTYTLRTKWTALKTRIHRHMTRDDPVNDEKRTRIRELFKQGPLYQWFATKLNTRTLWDGPSMPLPTFMEHLMNVARTYRDSGDLGMWNLYGVRQRWTRLRDHLVSRYWTAEWTPEKRAHVDRVVGAGMKVYEKLYPGYLTRDEYERFIFDDGCPLINDSIDLIVSSFTYCSNLNSVNSGRIITNLTHELRDEFFGPQVAHYLQTLLNATARASERIRETAQCRTKVLESYNLTRHAAMTRQARKQGRWFTFNPEHYASTDYLPRDHEFVIWNATRGTRSERYAWAWPRTTTPAPRIADHLNVSLVGVAAHRMARRTEGGVNFNLYSWILQTIDDIFNWGLVQSLDQFFVGYQEFFLNFNSKCSDYPNIGALWYVSFAANCEFPCNVDCRIGIGLEAALGEVLKYWGIALLIALVASPGIFTFLFSTTILFILFVIITPGLAWGWSVRCAFLTPSVFFGGISVPYLPIPVTMIFPFCLVDDILALLDKYITTCYDFWWPAYMVVGEVCPACPARFDFINCSLEVGMGDGLSNVLYAGFKLGGATWCDVINGLASSIGQIVLPGLPAYVSNQCTKFQTTSNAAVDQLDWCFWSTLPSLLLPTVLLVLAATFIGFILPAIFDVIVALFYVILASPLSVLWGQKSYLSATGDDDDDDDQPPADENDDERKPVASRYRATRGKQTIFHQMTRNVSDAYSGMIDYWQVSRYKKKID